MGERKAGYWVDRVDEVDGAAEDGENVEVGLGVEVGIGTLWMPLSSLLPTS